MAHRGDDTAIYTEDRKKVPWFDMQSGAFLDRTTAVIGASNSGKTVVVRSILHKLRNKFPCCLVIVPDNTRAAYEKIVPKCCMTETLAKGQLEGLWRRQKEATQCYSIANDKDTLRELFARLRSTSTKRHIAQLKSDLESICARIESDHSLEMGDKLAKMAILKKNVAARILSLYKEAIERNKKELAACTGLSDRERIALHYLRSNPRLLIVIDDSTEEFKRWMKMFKSGEDNVFNNIFYKGRHQFITLVFALQDDLALTTELRRNTHVSIYTTSTALITAVGRTNGGYSRDERKIASSIASRVFTDEGSRVKLHQKVCYLRDAPTPFHYLVAPCVTDSFRIGCKQLWAFSESVPKHRDNLRNNSMIASVLGGKKKQRVQSYTGQSSRTKYR